MPPLSAKTNPTDAELVRAAQEGDKAALETLARRWWPVLRRWAKLELASADLAEDAVQDAMIRMVRFIDRCDPERPFEAWLRTILRNCAHDVRGRTKVIEFPVSPTPVPADPTRRMDLDNAARRARQAFERLSPRQREAFHLCEHQGLPPTQAAEQLGVTPGTVRALLYQARKALRVHIADLHHLVRDP